MEQTENPVVWSILICSITSRKHFLDRLLAVLQPQVDATNGAVKIVIDTDDGEVSIGAKRQRMIENARGEHVSFIDDDDRISDDYVSLILNAFAVGADVVTFNVSRTRNGLPLGEMIHTLTHEGEFNVPLENGQIRYERLPNHRHAVRRELALAAGYPDWDQCEDSMYARLLYPLLGSEVWINKVLYHYDFVSHDKRNERTHAKRSLSAA